MAGHSKWANIKHRKAAKDAKKGKNFAQFSREVMMAAKIGGDNPDANFRLRTAIDRAKAGGLPNDTINRAIAKGAGNLDGDDTVDMTYEGYGPGGAAVFIEAMTDNKNRTAGDIRSYFNKYDGNLGSDGCVAWMFEERGLIVARPPESMDDDTLMLSVVEAGGDAMTKLGPDDNGFDDTWPPSILAYAIDTDPSALNAVCDGLTAHGIKVHSAEMTRVTDNETELTDANHITQFEKLMDAIESHDDVQSVYTNASVADDNDNQD